MTGAELKQARLYAGLTQQQLADKTGFHRLVVGYWENKPGEFTGRHGAPFAFAQALGMKHYWTPIRTRAVWGFTDYEQIRLDKECARASKMLAQREARRQVRCNAKTRKGTPCKVLSEPGKRRCKFHGGLSTGPKTVEGRTNISKAQKRRWVNWRLQKAESWTTALKGG